MSRALADLSPDSRAEPAAGRTGRAAFRWWKDPILRALGAAWLVAWLGFLLFDASVNGPLARQHLGALEAEFASVAPFPGAARERYDASSKVGAATVQAIYRAPDATGPVRDWYARELAAQGWMVAATAPLGHLACYDKSVYVATLSAFPNGGHTLGMSWGVSACTGGANDQGKPRTISIVIPLMSATLSALWLLSLRPTPGHQVRRGRAATAALLLVASLLGILAVIVLVGSVTRP